jgi:Methyltransferase domain
MNKSFESEAAESSCRLCGGSLQREFSLRVLDKYDVDYLKCRKCDSLQTEHPYWIKEAYTSSLSFLDTGAGQRNLTNLAAAYSLSRLLHLNDVLDFGGGDGLLCRLLRDYGINCFVDDKYAAATYASAFTTPNFLRPGILLAFEVLEHFEHPQKDLKALFQSNPHAVLASTEIYTGQGADWWYFAPQTGQHLFFYSEKALHLIAESYNYTLLICSGRLLFLRDGLAGRAKKHLAAILLQRHLLRLTSAAMRLLPASGVSNDFNLLRSGRK